MGRKSLTTEEHGKKELTTEGTKVHEGRQEGWGESLDAE
jgi:hypothetical protein